MKSPIINFRHGALLIGFLLALTAASVLAQDSPAPPVVKTRFDASGPAEKRGERVGAEGNLVLLPSNYRSAATGSDSQM
ncbi:MAG: hypothetical protein PSW75_02425, partial [bacterium]|nr:hypothetical protein [bacterium]